MNIVGLDFTVFNCNLFYRNCKHFHNLRVKTIFIHSIVKAGIGYWRHWKFSCVRSEFEIEKNGVQFQIATCLNFPWKYFTSRQAKVLEINGHVLVLFKSTKFCTKSNVLLLNFLLRIRKNYLRQKSYKFYQEKKSHPYVNGICSIGRIFF